MFLFSFNLNKNSLGQSPDIPAAVQINFESYRKKCIIEEIS